LKIIYWQLLISINKINNLKYFVWKDWRLDQLGLGLSLGRSSGSGRVDGSRSIGDWLNVVGLLGISVVDLLAHLLGEGQLNGGAGGGSQLGDALVDDLDVILDLGDGDALVLGQVLAGDSGQVNGLVNTGLDGLGVGNSDGGEDGGDDWAVVASLLGDLLAVVVTVAVVSVSRGWLAHSHHLGVADPLEGDLNSLGGGVLALLLVVVGADLVLDNLDALRADGSGDIVALLSVNDLLDWELNWSADSLESWGADLSSLNNILN